MTASQPADGLRFERATMLEPAAASQRARVIRLVEQILARNSISHPVSEDDELVAVGLTSVDMVNLMLAVEAEFGLMIPPTDITPENFRSVSSIGSMIARLGPPLNLS